MLRIYALSTTLVFVLSGHLFALPPSEAELTLLPIPLIGRTNPAANPRCFAFGILPGGVPQIGVGCTYARDCTVTTTSSGCSASTDCYSDPSFTEYCYTRSCDCTNGDGITNCSCDCQPGSVHCSWYDSVRRTFVSRNINC